MNNKLNLEARMYIKNSIIGKLLRKNGELFLLFYKLSQKKGLP